MNPTKELIMFFEKGYYAIPFMAFFEMMAIGTGLRFALKYKTGLFFIAYLIFDFSILVWDSYIEVSPDYTPDEYNFIVAFTNPLIACVELLVYYYYFIHVIKNSTV